MHLGQGKRDIGLGIAAELKQLPVDLGIIQVGKTVVIEFAPDLDAGILIQVIITAEVILIQ